MSLTPTIFPEGSNLIGNIPSEELLPLVYDELRHLAARRMTAYGPAATLQPTALVHEAWLRLAEVHNRRWNDKAHFFRTAAKAMRGILVDRARRKTAELHDVTERTVERQWAYARLKLDEMIQNEHE